MSKLCPCKCFATANMPLKILTVALSLQESHNGQLDSATNQLMEHDGIVCLEKILFIMYIKIM